MTEATEIEEVPLEDQKVIDLSDISFIEAAFELLTSEGKPLKSRRFITLLTYVVTVFIFGAGKAVWPEFMANYEVEAFAQFVGSIVAVMVAGYSLQDYAGKKYQAQ